VGVSVVLDKKLHTRLMEIVANAKGSPTMLPKLKLEALRYSTMLSYFFKDGEWREPYEGMKNPKGSRFLAKGVN
jgi:hypothetical protein